LVSGGALRRGPPLADEELIASKMRSFKQSFVLSRHIQRGGFGGNRVLFPNFPTMTSSTFSTKSTSDITVLFRRAVTALEQSESSAKPIDNTMKLELYALFKQAEVGPCTGSRPGMFDLVGKAKYDAWRNLGDMSKEAAMQKYVDDITDILGGLPEVTEVTTKTAETESKAASKPPITTSSDTKCSSVSFQVMSDLFPRRRPTSSLDELAAQFECVSLSVTSTGVALLTLNRPQRSNAFNIRMLEELRLSWEALARDSRVKVVVLSGSSSNFSSGMDLSVFVELQQQLGLINCDGRRREAMISFIDYLQQIVNGAELLPVPVIAAITGHCIGAGVDLICAADMRYATEDCKLCVKEVDLAIVADMGTTQRLPHLVGQSRAMELCYTGRTFTGKEAESMGLVLQTFVNEEQLLTHVMETANMIAIKSSLTIRGIKKTLLYSRDHSVDDSLKQVQLWNGGMCLSDDLAEAAMAIMQKRKPVYKDN
jgi:enoyl-CoA hydratase